jgi:glutathione synthase/RimK-type ligase-like ATP-grasp enzyme
MILIAGLPGESPVRLVIEAAQEAKIPFVLFDQHKAHSYEMCLRCVDNRISGMLQIGGIDYLLDDFDGVYCRVMDYQFLPEHLPSKKVFVGNEAAEKSKWIHERLLQWLDVAKCRLMNPPANGWSNISKPYQIQLIASSGLLVPPTCVTNQVDALREFQRASGGVIYKSISSARSIVKALEGVDTLSLDKLRFLPTQFQKKLQGMNVRVHVAGDSVFATSAATDVVDYRYTAREGGELEMNSFKLPDEIREHCLLLSRKLGLPLCGIDLFLTTEGAYYCFEVNPSPGYSFYEQTTGQKISSAIVQWLSGN